MAKLIVQHDLDPAIGMIFEEVEPGTPGRAQGFYGTCTECPHTIHRWHKEKALEDGARHVDSHQV